MEYWNQFQSLFRDALKFLAEALGFLGTHQWAGAIVLATLIVRTAMLPLAIKQVRSSQAMQRLAPEMARLRQKHAKDKVKLNEEVMELYRREGVNPFAGCLPVVAQMPIFFAMYYAIRGLDDVVKETMPFLGLGNLAENANKSAAGIILLAIMTAAQYLSTRQVSAGQDATQARMMRIMPFIFLPVMLNFPAGLVLYWATSNSYQLVQQTLMLRGRAKVEPVKKKPGRQGGQQQAAPPKPAPKPQVGPAGRPKQRPPVRTKPRSKRR